MDEPFDARPSQAPSPRRGRRRGLLWATLTLIAAGGLLVVRRAVEPATLNYRLEVIDRGPILSEVTALGTVSAVATVPVGAPVSSTVDNLYADVNEVVKRGQLLAQLHTPGATVRAPIPGVIVSRNVHVGEAVGPGQGALFTMTRDLSRILVKATVNEADVGRVAVGEAATLRTGAWPDYVSTATVSEVRLSPRGSRGAGGCTVLFEADNHDHKLLLGMDATVAIEVARRDGVLRLPLGALCFVPPGVGPTIPTDAHVGRVFVLDHGRPRPVRVTVGLEDPRHAELVAGSLREGDAVIVDQVR